MNMELGACPTLFSNNLFPAANFIYCWEFGVQRDYCPSAIFANKTSPFHVCTGNSLEDCWTTMILGRPVAFLMYSPGEWCVESGCEEDVDGTRSFANSKN